jgi:hypothetical protein
MSAKKNDKKAAKGPGASFLLLLAAFVAVSAAVLYMLTPAYYENRLLSGSHITYETSAPAGPGLEYHVQYRLRAAKGEVSLRVQWSEPGLPPGKESTGVVPPERYTSLYRFLEDYNRGGASSQAGGLPALTLGIGPASQSVPLGVEYKRFLDLKFRMLTDDFQKSSRCDGGRLLAERLDPASSLGVTRLLGSVFFNDADGSLILYRTRSGDTFHLGRDRLTDVNFEGLGLVVESGGALYFWEKKNLQNIRMKLAKPWEREGDGRRVFVSEKAVFYHAPLQGGAPAMRCLMRYDYINRKKSTLLKSTPLLARDMTQDGRYLLMEDSKGESFRVFDTAKGEFLSDAPLPPQGWKVFAFGEKPGSYYVYGDGKAGLWRAGIGGGMTPIGRGMGGKGGIKPLATSAGGKKLLFAARDGACYVYDPATGREDPVKGAPARMGCPRFSPDGKGIYFVRFDCLLYAPVEER